MSSNMKIIRICEFCKEQFTAKTTRTKYCSHRCNSRAYKVKDRNEKVEASNQETAANFSADLERIRLREFLNITQASLLLGISRRTIYRLIDRGELNTAKYGTRSVIRKCDLEAFFAIPIVEATMKPLQEFPGIDNCYSIGEIQKKFSISPAGLYLLLQRQGISKYTVGKYTYVAKEDIDIILNCARI